MNKFIVIEGLDGSGKSTQIRLLKEYFQSTNIKYKYLHFPRTDCLPYGEMIAKFLRGEFGEVASVNPYLVALLYALDREKAKDQISDWISQGFLVLLDRYVYSNMAFQCAKCKNKEEKVKLRNWIFNLEYNYNKIPKPDLSILLNVPFRFVSNSLTESRFGHSRRYLNGKSDIHETSLSLQENVQREYFSLVNSNEDFVLIDCRLNNADMLSPDEINRKIIEVIHSILDVLI